MAKAGRGQTRRDSKRRVLRPGESVRADGKYQYKYHIDGKPHFVLYIVGGLSLRTNCQRAKSHACHSGNLKNRLILK